MRLSSTRVLLEIVRSLPKVTLELWLRHLRAGELQMKSTLRAAMAVAFTSTCLAGCVSVFEGTSQDISVNTNPTGALCTFNREDGMTMCSVNNTPGNLMVRNNKYDLTITCTQPGYQD